MVNWKQQFIALFLLFLPTSYISPEKMEKMENYSFQFEYLSLWDIFPTFNDIEEFLSDMKKKKFRMVLKIDGLASEEINLLIWWRKNYIFGFCVMNNNDCTLKCSHSQFQKFHFEQTSNIEIIERCFQHRRWKNFL